MDLSKDALWRFLLLVSLGVSVFAFLWMFRFDVGAGASPTESSSGWIAVNDRLRQIVYICSSAVCVQVFPPRTGRMLTEPVKPSKKQQP